MKVTVSGATGRIGRHLVAALKQRGDEVVALSRDPDKASELLGVQAYAWDLKNEAVPRPALEGCDAVVHLAGEDVGQRWSKEVKAEILDSREKGTRNMVHSIFDTKPRPRTLVCASASGYYGAARRRARRRDRAARATTGSPRSARAGSARPRPRRSAFAS